MQDDPATKNPQIQNKCPEPPSPFPIPSEPAVNYDKIPKAKREELQGEQEKKIDDADLTKQEHLAAAAKVQETAQTAHDTAGTDFETAKGLLNRQLENKKKQLFREYKQGLRNDLPKGYAPPDNMDIENDNHVPSDKKAVRIAELEEKLAQEDVIYVTALKQLSEKKTSAENDLRAAQKAHELEVSLIHAQEKQTLAEAKKEWRAKLSDELANFCS